MTRDMIREILAMTREDSGSRMMTRDSTRNSAPGKSNDSRLDSRLNSHDSCTALKSGPPDDVSNYRPIALTSVFSKIMERVRANEVSGYFIQHGLISKQQHGFLTRRFTNLVKTLNDWTLAVNTRKCVNVAYIDYKKAFDSVCHNKLFIKLNAYGIAGSLLSWIKDFLFNRSQVTQVGAECSSEKGLVSGIVQGSCLRPLLFLAYVNDVTDILPSHCTSKLFADDLKLYSVAHTIQKSLEKLYHWSNEWQLTISYQKGSIMSIGRSNSTDCFNIGSNTVQPVCVTKDLGVHVCSDLSFATHVHTIAAKAHARACLMHKCFISRDPVTLYSNMLQLYCRRIMLIK